MNQNSSYMHGEKTAVSESSILTLEDASSLQEIDERAPRKFMWWIPIQSHVHPLQFLAMIVSVFVSLSLIVYIAGTQNQIIMGILGINDQSGDITGSLSLYSEILALVGVIAWSMAADRIGRRGVMSSCIVIMGAAVVSYTHVSNVYPQMLIIRLVFSVGSAGSTAMMVAMMMEIAVGKGGLVAGSIGIASGLGATFAALCLFMVPALLSITYTEGFDGLTYSHTIVGSTAMGLGVILFFCMPKDSYTRPPVNHFKGYLKKLYVGIQAGKEPRIALGYASSFFARADEIIITNFLSLWVAKYYVEMGRCKVGEKCLYALASSSTLSGYSQLVALSTTAFFALASEYAPKEWAVLVAGIVGACGCIPFAFSIDPTTKLSLGFVILIATGQYGMIISGMAMVSGDFIDRKDHAAISATYSFVGAIGIIILSKVGGVLFDKWMKGAPFLLLGIGHCLMALMSIAVYAHRFIIERRKKALGNAPTYITEK
jgi:MFS family permease